MSQSKNRIFIGNIPRKWEESDLKNAVTQVGPGVLRVDLMKVQFYSNASIKDILPLSLEVRTHKAISSILVPPTFFQKNSKLTLLIRV